MTDSRATERCPSRADLLCAIEGELSAKERLPLLAHLTRCAACRRSVDEISGYVELFAATLDRPFDAAEAVRARFNEFLQRLHQQKQALIHATSGYTMRRWLPFAAVVPLLVVAFVLAWTQDVVKADELVMRAIATDRAVPAGSVSLVRVNVIPANPALMRGTPAAVRLASLTITREITHGATVGASGIESATFAPNDNEAALAQLLAASRFDLRHPLGMDAFQAWRDSLTTKQDRVSASGERVVLLTTTPEGMLREAELTVRRDTFRVVRLMLTFEGIGRVVFEEIAPPTRRPEALTAEASAAPRLSATAPSPVAPRVPASAAPASAPAVSAPRAMSRPELSTWRARTFRDGVGGDRFVPEFQRLVASVKTRLHALRDLAKQDGGTPASEPLPGAGATRQQQIDESYAALCADLEDLNGLVSVLFGTRDRVAAAERTPEGWERRANTALRHAEALERSVEELLMHADLPPKAFGPTSRHPVIVTFGALWDAISAANGQPSRP